MNYLRLGDHRGDHRHRFPASKRENQRVNSDRAFCLVKFGGWEWVDYADLPDYSFEGTEADVPSDRPRLSDRRYIRQIRRWPDDIVTVLEVRP